MPRGVGWVDGTEYAERVGAFQLPCGFIYTDMATITANGYEANVNHDC